MASLALVNVRMSMRVLIIGDYSPMHLDRTAGRGAGRDRGDATCSHGPGKRRDRGPIPMGNGGSVTKRTLADALQAAAEPKPAAKKTIPSRRGKRAWVTYLDPNTSRQLKAAAAMSDRSMQSLGVEAAELLIERYGTR